MTIQQYQQEQAERAVAERWDTVMNNPAARGRETLAKSLLAVNGNHRLTPQQIITALEKAPASGGSPTPPAAQTDPTLAVFEAPNVAHGWWNLQLYEAGRASAMAILGKKE